MKTHLLNSAVAEAERFLERARDLDALQDAKKYHPDLPSVFEGGPYTAAVRRASMDPTRALSVLRANK